MDKKHEIHIQTLVEGYASALVHTLDWENRVSLTMMDINDINNFAKFLDNKFGDDYIQDMTFDEVKQLIKQYIRQNSLNSSQDVVDKNKRLVNHTKKYVELETRDMEKFESWLKIMMRKTGMLKTFS